METFFTIIFVGILSIYLIGIIGKYALRYWISKKQKEFAQQFGSGKGFSYKEYTWGGGKRGTSAKSTQREGEVRIERTGGAEKRVSKNVGDYVDYEEIEETE